MNQPVDEIVGFLIDRNPSKLDAILYKYDLTENREFKRGTKLGGSNQAEEGLLHAKCEAATAALEEALLVIPVQIETILSRIKRANAWESIGAFVAIFGAAGSIAALWPDKPQYVQEAQISTAVALIGSLCTLSVKSVRKTLLGNVDNIAKEIGGLQDSATKAEQLLPVLRYATKQTEALVLEETSKSITQSNDLVRIIRQQILSLR